MSGWSWQDVYPGTVTVTMVLDRADAAELLDQAAEEGRIIGPRIIRGMPAIAFSEEIPPPKIAVSISPQKERAPETQMALGKLAGAAAKQFQASDKPAADPKIALLPAVRQAGPKRNRKRQESGGEVVALRRPSNEPPSTTVKEVDPDLRAQIDTAVAAGKVTKCPPCKHSVEPGQLLPGEGWPKKRKRGRPRKRAD